MLNGAVNVFFAELVFGRRVIYFGFYGVRVPV